MNNKYSELKEKLEFIPYIPYIEYDNKINDLFETNTIKVNTSSLLYLQELSPESNKSESNNIVCKKFQNFKKYLCKLFI